MGLMRLNRSFKIADSMGFLLSIGYGGVYHFELKRICRVKNRGPLARLIVGGSKACPI